MNSGALLRIKMSTFCFVFKGTDARFSVEIAQPLKKDGHYFLMDFTKKLFETGFERSEARHYAPETFKM